MAEEIRYCCRGMEHSVQGDLQFWPTVCAQAGPDGPMFVMQAKAVSKEKMKEIFDAMSPARREGMHLDAVLTLEIVISYCPWCGRKLSRYYTKTWRAFPAPLGTPSQA